MFGVPQGSILGALLFNNFLADLFFIHSDIDIANFADDNTPYLSAKNIEDVIESLERASVSLFRWFENNLLKGNDDKCHFLVSTIQEVNLNVNSFKIKSSYCEKLLGVKFDSKLRFDQHISDLCRRTSRKIHALARVTPFMNLSRRRLLMNFFFMTQFNYCPLIWMCHSRENNREINRLYEKCLRTIYNEKQSSFNEVLEKDGSISIHERNLQVLATEMYKISNGLSTPLMKDIFPVKRNPYNLRQNSQFSRPRINTLYHGTEKVSNLGPKIWDLVPSNVKEISDLDKFKKAVKEWKTEDFPCRLCKVHVQNVGFLEKKTLKK